MARFNAALSPTADLTASERIASELVDRWREPQRHHHTLDHLVAVLDVIDRHATLAPHPDLVRLAAWFHDAVYDPTAPANEERSAELAVARLTDLGLDRDGVLEVNRLVLLTATHDPRPGDANGALLVDADLAVLAYPGTEYDAYAGQIRREYHHVTDEHFAAGRVAVLRRLMIEPALYRILPERERLQTLARANMTREIGSHARTHLRPTAGHQSIDVAAR